MAAGGGIASRGVHDLDRVAVGIGDRALAAVADKLSGMDVKKVLVVPGRLVNVVAR